MLKTGIEENLCCGCEACVQVCPKGAVVMQKGFQGCQYPATDMNICIDCGLCEKVCPMNAESIKPLQFKKAKESIAAFHNDAAVRESSSSGGAFTGLVQAFCEDADFEVFGAQLQDDFSVVFKSASTLDGLGIFRKSKYIPSRINGAFKSAKKALDAGKKVVFSGTPCQIAALKLFLKKDFENLFTIDFSCHGVALPDVFLRYIKEVGDKCGSKVVSYDFRHKAKSLADYSCVCSKFTFENSKTLVRYKDPWFRAFVAALFKRPSCFECPFAGIARTSDATIADYWGVDKISKIMTSGKGISLVLPNTEKGESAAAKLSRFMTVESFATEACQRYNIPLNHRVEHNPKAEIFMRAMESNSFEKSVEIALGKIPLWNRIDEFAMRVFPIRTRMKINGACKKFTGRAKNLLNVLPAPLREKILKKWAKMHGRQYIKK